MLISVNDEEFKLISEILFEMKFFKKNAEPLVEATIERLSTTSDFTSTAEVDVAVIQRIVSHLNIIKVRGKRSGPLIRLITPGMLKSLQKLDAPLKLDFLKTLSSLSRVVLARDARVLLPTVYELMIELSPTALKPEEKIDVECLELLLYSFHQLGNKTPGTLNGLCGFHIITGQPADFEENPKENENLKLRMNFLVKTLAEVLEETVTKAKNEKDEKQVDLLNRRMQSIRNIMNYAKRLLTDKPDLVNKGNSPTWMRAHVKGRNGNQKKQGGNQKMQGKNQKKSKNQKNQRGNRKNQGNNQKKLHGRNQQKQQKQQKQQHKQGQRRKRDSQQNESPRKRRKNSGGNRDSFQQNSGGNRRRKRQPDSPRDRRGNNSRVVTVDSRGGNNGRVNRNRRNNRRR
eukprot:TRINITY_DN8782_c0_g2_i4.p2 TRINITY_DN8782_c0_g2~~TRINITY_DN8782_c0_g2_i4.p2  ORF type:complete len:401 (-),score=79.17 TRINITY_DN8782_c0_g2_i4:1984-3186(-)